MEESFSEKQSRDYFIDLMLGLEFCKLMTLNVMLALPSILSAVHSQHVIHRDIKPQNLLLDDSDRIKVSYISATWKAFKLSIWQIADFGVSEQIERSEASISRWAGTPAFVAPETLCKKRTGQTIVYDLPIASSNSFKGQAVDIWAAGVTLFCFVFGKVLCVRWWGWGWGYNFQESRNRNCIFPRSHALITCKWLLT